MPENKFGLDMDLLNLKDNILWGKKWLIANKYQIAIQTFFQSDRICSELKKKKKILSLFFVLYFFSTRYKIYQQ